MPLPDVFMRAAAKYDELHAIRNDLACKAGLIVFGLEAYAALVTENPLAVKAASISMITCSLLSIHFDKKASEAASEHYLPSNRAINITSSKLALLNKTLG